MLTVVRHGSTIAIPAVYVTADSPVAHSVTMDEALHTAQEAEVDGFDVRRKLQPALWSSSTLGPLYDRERRRPLQHL
jgi:hypothetical protein